MTFSIRVFHLLLLLCFFVTASAQYATYMTVAQDGSGDYTSIQDAIDNTKSFPDQAITIFVKNGVYREKVRIYAWNTRVTLLGEDREKTIITYDDHFKRIDRGRNSTFLTHTLWVEANDFTARNLTIENTAGAVGQAIALSVSGDRCVFENCTILGHQDTLYCTGESSRQYFTDCLIAGTTDFIFGNATAVFDKCTIRSLSDSFVTAASTTPRQHYGLIFLDCRLTAADGVAAVYLGRPWRAYAKTAFINCTYGDHILPEGWDDWGQPTNHQTASYAEYAPSENLEGRVDWAKKLRKKQLKNYKLTTIFSGWTPRSGSATK
ncbi:pectinesterase family protein [Flavilitoribacter nigricans]|uniref:Pectinesterase n=1 Tax=Flavilitoribacter nigricans (strain ATCC 23147 / DSM 23189 / NBRC 102662 / NCIMB 1420 / SS-2) TaxID=1122177 RepID=A0A2D0MZU2_FLAN2|nr:pectinesterase family protein [Flavilitoribacter nigricans]PHN01648.1 pectin esterase [Flavilitoribacter nigricans DSM 23189 = NBRC 102662]